MPNSTFFKFETIYIEKVFRDHKNVHKILAKMKHNPEIVMVDDLYGLIKELPVIHHPRERSGNLFLGGIRGDILRKCPGSQGHICCNYYVINLYIGCPINCSYCILQSYLNQPFTIINVDIEKIMEHLEIEFRNNPQRIYRIGTGELGDSLVYDPMTEFSIDFIRFFSKFKKNIFEFKTKTSYIDNLFRIQSSPNIVIGFSVNPQSMIDREEEFAASLKERMDSARKLCDYGYKVAFHFDPMFHVKDFDRLYSGVVDTIFKNVPKEAIAWISLGTFRYTPDLKNTIEYCYPESPILEDEFVENRDKKFRYFKPLRHHMYQTIYQQIRKYSQHTLVYLCMESPDMWNESLGHLPLEEKKNDLLFKKAIDD